MCVPLTVTIRTDTCPEETSWSLFDACAGETQLNIPTETEYTNPGPERFTNEYCVPPSRYTFTIFDTSGDGFTKCDTTDGFYSVTYDGTEVASGEGDFGYFESTTFGSAENAKSGKSAKAEAAKSGKSAKTCEPPGPTLTCNDVSFETIEIGETAIGTNVGGPVIEGGFFCGTLIEPGTNVAWYVVEGNGSEITASTCDAATDYDTKISVFTSCQSEVTAPVCVDGNDGFFCSQVTWFAEEGELYYIMVHGFSRQVGTFGLTVEQAPSVSGAAGQTTANTDTDKKAYLKPEE